MATKLSHPLKREVIVNGKPYMLTIDTDGFKLVPKGKRKGEVAWRDLVSGEAALAVALNASLAGRSARRPKDAGQMIAQRVVRPPRRPPLPPCRDRRPTGRLPPRRRARRYPVERAQAHRFPAASRRCNSCAWSWRTRFRSSSCAGLSCPRWRPEQSNGVGTSARPSAEERAERQRSPRSSYVRSASTQEAVRVIMTPAPRDPGAITRDASGVATVELMIDVPGQRIRGSWRTGAERKTIDEHRDLSSGTYWGPLIFLVLKNFEANAKDGRGAFQ